jgi:hypothetical protein
MKLRCDPKIDRFINSVSTACNRIRFIDLPEDEPDPNQPNIFFFSSIEAQKHHVKDEVSKLVCQSESSRDSPTLSGFVLDMFCIPMIDVANEFGVPSYIFLTSGAAYLGLQFLFRLFTMSRKLTLLSSRARMLSWSCRVWQILFQLRSCLLSCLTKSGCQFSSV